MRLRILNPSLDTELFILLVLLAAIGLPARTCLCAPWAARCHRLLSQSSYVYTIVNKKIELGSRTVSIPKKGTVSGNFYLWHCIRLMPSVKPDCPRALQRKARSIAESTGRQSLLGLSRKNQEIGACSAHCERAKGEDSVHFRLDGGGRSLALTFLRENSLLTGKITGNS